MRPFILTILVVTGVVVAPRLARAGCESDSQCKGDRICEAGVCVAPPVKAPATCSADTDCTGDAICEKGTCVAPSSSVAPPATTTPTTTTTTTTTTTPATSTSPATPPGPPQGAAEGPTTTSSGVKPPPPAAHPVVPAAPGPADEIVDKKVAVTAFLSPAGGSLFYGLEVDASMTARGKKTGVLGAFGGFGRRSMDVAGGLTTMSVDSFHVGAYVGYQWQINPLVAYRLKAGGLAIKDSEDQSGAGALLGGESRLGRLVVAVDMWVTKSANLLVRFGFEF